MATPVFSAESPTGTGVSKVSPIYFEVDDPGIAGINSATLNVTVGGVDAIIDGVFQTGWSGSITPDGGGGIDVTINKDTAFASYSNVAVYGYVEDFDTNPATTNWSFQVVDYLGPIVTAVNPTWGQINVPLLSHIVIRLQDEQEVVVSTIKVYIDTGSGFDLAYEGGGSPDFKPGWDGPASALTGSTTDRLLTIDRTTNLPSLTTIGVWVFAEDVSGNPARTLGISMYGTATFGSQTFGG